MRARVFVEDWQHECCGDPFTVGSTVKWQVVPPDLEWLTAHLGPAEAATVTHCEERHSDDVPDSVDGRVTAIQAVFYRAEARPGEDPRWFFPMPGSTKLVPLADSRAWKSDDGLSFAGFLVDLA